MDKRIYTWKWGNNLSNDEYESARAFIFGNYGEDFAHYAKMVAEAKKDFPNLKDKDIIVSKVTESSYMKHFAVISFSVKPETRVKGYEFYGGRKMDFRY